MHRGNHPYITAYNSFYFQIFAHNHIGGVGLVTAQRTTDSAQPTSRASPRPADRPIRCRSLAHSHPGNSPPSHPSATPPETTPLYRPHAATPPATLARQTPQSTTKLTTATTNIPSAVYLRMVFTPQRVTSFRQIFAGFCTRSTILEVPRHTPQENDNPRLPSHLRRPSFDTQRLRSGSQARTRPRSLHQRRGPHRHP